MLLLPYKKCLCNYLSTSVRTLSSICTGPFLSCFSLLSLECGLLNVLNLKLLNKQTNEECYEFVETWNPDWKGHQKSPNLLPTTCTHSTHQSLFQNLHLSSQLSCELKDKDKDSSLFILVSPSSIGTLTKGFQEDSYLHPQSRSYMVQSQQVIYLKEFQQLQPQMCLSWLLLLNVLLCSFIEYHSKIMASTALHVLSQSSQFHFILRIPSPGVTLCLCHWLNA